MPNKPTPTRKKHRPALPKAFALEEGNIVHEFPVSVIPHASAKEAREFVKLWNMTEEARIELVRKTYAWRMVVITQLTKYTQTLEQIDGMLPDELEDALQSDGRYSFCDTVIKGVALLQSQLSEAREECERLKEDRDCEKRLRKDAGDSQTTAEEQRDILCASLVAAKVELAEAKKSWEAEAFFDMAVRCATAERELAEANAEIGRLKNRADNLLIPMRERLLAELAEAKKDGERLYVALSKCHGYLMAEIRRLTLNESAHSGVQALAREISEILDAARRDQPQTEGRG